MVSFYLVECEDNLRFPNERERFFLVNFVYKNRWKTVVVLTSTRRELTSNILNEKFASVGSALLPT